MDSHRLPRKQSRNVSLWGPAGKKQRNRRKVIKKAIAKEEAQENAKIIREINTHNRSVKAVKNKQAAEEKAYIKNGTPPKTPSTPWEPGAKYQK